MDIGMPFLIETNTLEDCAKLCCELKLDFVELNMNFLQCQIEKLDPQELKRLKEKYGIYFTLHVDELLNVCDFNKRVREAYLQTMLDTIDLAREINAPIINMHLSKGIYITLPDKKRFLFEENVEHFKSCLLHFRDICTEHIGDSGIKIAVENTDGFEAYEKEAILILLQSDAFGLTLDTGHSHAVGDRDIPFFIKNKQRLIHMHGHDAKGKSNHLALGEGEIDLCGRFGMAREVNARIVLEIKTISALTASVAVLNEYI